MNEWMWVQLLYSLQQKLFLFVSLIELDMVLMSLIFVALLLCTFKPMILQWQFATWVFSSCFSTERQQIGIKFSALPSCCCVICLFEHVCARASVCVCPSEHSKPPNLHTFNLEEWPCQRHLYSSSTLSTPNVQSGKEWGKRSRCSSLCYSAEHVFWFSALWHTCDYFGWWWWIVCISTGPSSSAVESKKR